MMIVIMRIISHFTIRHMLEIIMNTSVRVLHCTNNTSYRAQNTANVLL
jgi:hypothetical protein